MTFKDEDATAGERGIKGKTGNEVF